MDLNMTLVTCREALEVKFKEKATDGNGKTG